jgi:hypothetical protein
VEVLEHTTDFRIVEPVPGRGAADSPLVRPAPDSGPAGSFTSPLLEVEDQEELAEEEKRRRLLELPPALPLKDRPPLGSDRVLRPRVQRVVATAAIGEVDCEQLGGETISEVLDALGCWHFENAQYAGAVKVTVGQAIKSAEAELWVAAMKAEIQSLISGGTLVLTKRSDIVGAHRILHSTAQLKKKLFQDLSVDKYKCRLCVCGNELYGQVPETYSPTVGALAHAAVHQIAVMDNMKMCLVDVVQAYLYHPYPSTAMPLYLVLPDNLSRACGLEPGALYRIAKYLYGLPDAGLAYYKAYSAHLEAGGYRRTISDPCLFVKIDSRGNRVYVFCHVDDTMVCADDPRELLVL